MPDFWLDQTLRPVEHLSSARGQRTRRTSARQARTRPSAPGREKRPGRPLVLRDMCGIIGKVMAPRSGAGRSGRLERMCAGLEHRGPDSRGVFVEAGSRAGDPAPAGRRPGHGRSADLQRGRLGRRRPQRRDLQLPGAARAAARRGPPLRDRRRHRGHRPPLRGVRRSTASATSTACSRSRCGTRRGSGCCWRATGSARSRSSTPLADGGMAFASELARADRGPDDPREVDPRAVDCSWPTATCRRPLSIFSGGPEAAAGAHAGARGRASRRSTATGAWTTRAS